MKESAVSTLLCELKVTPIDLTLDELFSYIVSMRNTFHEYWLTDPILSGKGMGLLLRIHLQVKSRTMFIVAWFKMNRSDEKQVISLL